MKTLGAYFAVYNNHDATEFVLSNFKQHFSDSIVVLISDGGKDFTEIADKYNCKYFYKENLFGNSQNGYPTLPYNAYRTEQWWARQKLTCDETGADYIIILEDDVYIRSGFNITEDFYLRGARIGNTFSSIVSEQINNSHYGMCGGSIYNASVLKQIYDDVIVDIRQHHDKLLNDKAYFELGAVDANITYHFNKRGYKYEISPWMVEMREGSIGSNPIVHQYKQYY